MCLGSGAQERTFNIIKHLLGNIVYNESVANCRQSVAYWGLVPKIVKNRKTNCRISRMPEEAG
jgi:hypothetical protein